jgi:hypothetical protein
MCTIDNIKLSVTMINAVKLVMALFVMVIGGLYADGDTIHKSYGIYYLGTGVGIMFLGIFSSCVVCPLAYAVKRHNKFVLVICFFVDTLIMTQVITLGLKCYEPTISPFDSALEADCLRHSPEIYSTEECNLYLFSERIAGFRLGWAGLFSRIKNADYYQTITTFENDNLCCGFGPPLRCVNDSRPFPSDRPMEHVMSYMLHERVVCGEKPNYYREQSNCLDYFDPNAFPPIVGGCDWDMSGGPCMEDELSGASKGCADVFEEYVASLVGPYALILTASSGTNLLSMLLACCMYWKRKETDTFPDFVRAELVSG